MTPHEPDGRQVSEQAKDLPAGKDAAPLPATKAEAERPRRKAAGSCTASELPIISDGSHPLLTDERIRQKAANAENGQKFQDLWNGRWQEYFSGPSGADHSLIFTLAFYTKSREQLDRMFRQSGMMRKAWDNPIKDRDETYGQQVISKALETVTEQYQIQACLLTAEDGQEKLVEMVPLGEHEPTTEKIVLSQKRTLPTATSFVEEFYQHPDWRTLLSYAGTFWSWRNNRYVLVEKETLKQQLLPWLHDALRYMSKRNSNVKYLVPFEANPTTVKAAIESIQTHAHLPVDVVPPAWLVKNMAADSEKPYPADEILSCKSFNLHIPTRKVLPATPAFFNTNALDFNYDDDPEYPALWDKFLTELWGNDEESIRLLQEWFGYSLTTDTSQQKMLLLVGPRRCGKGTIARILTQLVGEVNVCGPGTSSLAGPFGLQPLLGKSLAIISDARFSGKDMSTVIERLLCISGEDALTVDRKHIESLTMKLPVRFMFLSNELPRLAEVSGALAGRFLILRLTKSFFGREDTELTKKLSVELPGILYWALYGWRNLHERGHFLQPESAREAVSDLEDLASPVGAFVRECCVIGEEHRETADNLYAAWKVWCEEEGRQFKSTRASFGRDLQTVEPNVCRRRGTNDVRFYEGIGLRYGTSS